MSLVVQRNELTTVTKEELLPEFPTNRMIPVCALPIAHKAVPWVHLSSAPEPAVSTRPGRSPPNTGHRLAGQTLSPVFL